MNSIIHKRKKTLYGGVAILLGVIMASLAWAQIVAALSRCFSPF